MRTWTLSGENDGILSGAALAEEEEVWVIEREPVLDLLERLVIEADAKWPRGQSKKLPGPTMYGVISDTRHFLVAHGRRGVPARGRNEDE